MIMIPYNRIQTVVSRVILSDCHRRMQVPADGKGWNEFFCRALSFAWYDTAPKRGEDHSGARDDPSGTVQTKNT
jgi:hypothetical protein